MEIKVPDLGEGVNEAQVLSFMVNVDDEVAVDDTILELETDKAVAPVPSTHAGRLKTILVKEGQTVKPGDVLCVLHTENTSSKTPDSSSNNELPQPISSSFEASDSPVSVPENISNEIPLNVVSSIDVKAFAQDVAVKNRNAMASASLKHAATLLGIDLSVLKGSAHGGRVTPQDVQSYLLSLQQESHSLKKKISDLTSKEAPVSKSVQLPLPDFSQYGEIKSEKLSTLRKKIADKMSQSWRNVPHVTQFMSIDITQINKLREKYKGAFQEKGAKLTVMVMLFHHFLKALKAFPQFNSSYDEENQMLIIKEFYNFGVAVDTDQGLIVPVIRNLDQKNLLDIAKELPLLAKKARDRSLEMSDLQGGTFTVSNLGSFGVGPFTPIINVPEVAIIGLGRSETQVTPEEKRLVSKTVLPLSLSYDHRVIDGADAARFVAFISDSLSNYDEAMLVEALNE